MWNNIVKFINFVINNYLWLFIVICVCLLALIILLILIIVDSAKSKKRKKEAAKNNQANAPNEPVVEEQIKEEKVEEQPTLKKERPKRGAAPKKVEAKKEEKVEEVKKAEKPVEAKKAENVSKPKKETVKEAPKPEPVKKVTEESEEDEKKGTLTGKYRLIYEKENKSWVIRKDGAGRTIRRVKTKKEALEIIENMQKENEDIKVIVHKKNGKFQKKDSYTRSYNQNKDN